MRVFQFIVFPFLFLPLFFSCDNKVVATKEQTVQNDSTIRESHCDTSISVISAEISTYNHLSDIPVSYIIDSFSKDLMIYKSIENEICLGFFKDSVWKSWKVFSEEQHGNFSASLDRIKYNNNQLVSLSWESIEAGAGGSVTEKGLQIWELGHCKNLVNTIVAKEANDFGTKNEEGEQEEYSSKHCNCKQEIEVNLPSIKVDSISCLNHDDESFNELCKFEGLAPGNYEYNGECIVKRGVNP